MSKRQRVMDSEDYSASPAPLATTRPRRGTVNRAPPPAPTTIERSSPDETRTSSIRLTVKADPKKLQAATSTTKATTAENGNGRGSARSSRKKAIIESESDAEGSEEEEEQIAEDEDEEMEDDEEESEEEEDAEGSDEDDEDEEMEDAPPAPPPPAPAKPQKISVTKPQVTITPAKPLPSVESKEISMANNGGAEDEDDDDDLSSLDEDEDEEELDAEGDEDEEDAEGEEDEDISRSATPDPSKLTRRQRAEAQGLMALSNEAQKKKHLTADEISLRRAEMARRRKALSEKRNDEEKQDTINRLLKRQATKRQRKADVEADRIAEEGEDGVVEGGRAANKVFVRYVQSTRGSVLAVPREWVESGLVGGVFGREGVKATKVPWTGRMVEVVE